MLTKNCLFCKKELFRKKESKTKQYFCNNFCRGKAMSHKENFSCEKPKHYYLKQNIFCKNCKKSFKQNNKKQKYCSVSCYKLGVKKLFCELHQCSYEKHCKKCNTKAVQNRREKLKLLAFEYKGSKCKHCGYNKCLAAIEFHHLDPTKKDFGISSKGYTRSWQKVKEELDKCIMVCANCHREIHEKIKNDAKNN
jgi:ribosomal protein L30E